MKKFSTRGAAWDSMFLTFVKILTTLSSIILTKILSTGLSLEAYGTYTQTNTVIAIGTSLILLGFCDAINYFYNNESAEKDKNIRIRIVNTIFLLEIIAGAIFACISVFGRGLISDYFSNILLQPILVVVAFKPLLDNINYFYQQLYISTGQAKVIAVRNLVITILKMATMYVAVYILKDILWIFVALLLLDAVQLLFFKIHFQRIAFSVNPLQISKRHVRKIMVYSLPMGIFALTSALTREMNKLVIGRLTDTETMAIYGNCSRILPFDIIVVSFATVLIPYIMRYVSSGRKGDLARLFCNYMKIGYYSVWILGTAVLITSKQVISLLYTDEYVQGNTVFVIYVIDSMIKFASMHLILTAGGKSKTIMTYSMISLGLNLVLNIAFYYMLGINGPALATLVTTALYTFMILRESVKLINAKWTDVFDVKDLTSFVLILAVTGAAFYGANYWFLHMGVHNFVAMLLSAGGFCFLNLLINWKRIGRTLRTVNELRM